MISQRMLAGICERTREKYRIKIDDEALYVKLKNLPKIGFKTIDFFNLEGKTFEVIVFDLFHTLINLHNEIHILYGVFESQKDLDDFVLLHLLFDEENVSMIRDTSAVFSIIFLMQSTSFYDKVILRNSSIEYSKFKVKGDEAVKTFVYKIYRNVILQKRDIPRDKVLNFISIKHKLDIYGRVTLPLETYLYFSKKLKEMTSFSSLPLETLEDRFYKNFYK